MERSWSRSGPKKSYHKRLLAGLRGHSREFSAILEAQRLRKGRPRGSKIEVRKRSKLKMAKPLKSPTVARILMICKVSGSLFLSQKLFKMVSESHLRRGSPQKASWRPLGTLLEAFGAQKSNWKRLLDGPRPPRRLVSALPGSQMPSQKQPRRVPNRGPKMVQAQNGKTLIFNDSCRDFNDF